MLVLWPKGSWSILSVSLTGKCDQQLDHLNRLSCECHSMQENDLVEALVEASCSNLALLRLSPLLTRVIQGKQATGIMVSLGPTCLAWTDKPQAKQSRVDRRTGAMRAVSTNNPAYSSFFSKGRDKYIKCCQAPAGAT